MQPSNIGIAEGTNIRPVRYLILVQSALAAERAGGRWRQRMLLVPVIMVAAARGFGSTLRGEGD
jgi:hypothetical protein